MPRPSVPIVFPFRATAAARVARWRSLLVLAVALGAGRGAAQDARYSFEQYGTVAGLAGPVITVALQTRDGYLWVGTPSGLSRFDGVRYVSFHASDTPGLPSDVICGLREDAGGALWIGTAKGMTRYAAGRFERVGPLERRVSSLAADARGRLLVGTLGDGLWAADGARLEKVNLPGLAGDAAVRTVLGDSAGRLWVALENGRGVLRTEAGRFVAFNGGEGLVQVISMAEHPRGMIWFGTQRNGLYRLEADRLEHVDVAPGRGDPAIFQILPGRDGGIWVAAGGLYRAANPDAAVFGAIPNLPNQNVRGLCEDGEAGLWLCAGSEGLARLRPTSYRLITSHAGLPGNHVKTVAEDAAGTRWLSIRGLGVVRLDRDGSVLTLGPEQGLARGDPAVVLPTRDGTVWVGLTSHLWAGRDGSWRQDPELRYVRGLHQDRAGTVWVGTDATGLFRRDGSRFAAVRTESGAIVPGATSFADAADGSLIVGTWRNGMFRVAAGAAAATPVRGLPTDEVRAVWVDPEDRVWVGLSGRGLAVREHDRWLNPAALTEALGGQVCGIIGDAQGRLWLGTLAGIAWASREELLRWMRQPDPVPPIHAIAVGTEIGTLPVWSGGQPVVWPAADGTLLFATRRGVAVIDPARATLNTVAPPVHVERVYVDRRASDPGRPVRMPAGTRSLTIEYTALSFAQPGRVLFRYKLEGFDGDWVDAGTRRTAFYGRLPPGDYTFNVRACNNDGIWNEAGARIRVVQAPHVYETTWFRVLAALALAGVAWGAYAWSNRQLRLRLERLERERAMENERRRIAQDLHDDLGARLTEIGLFADNARRNATDGVRPGLDFLADRVRTLVGSLDAIVWAVNPANDTLDQLVSYVADLFQELLRPSSIRPRLDIAADVPRLPLTAEERSDLFFALKEAINNLLKHSGATEARLRVVMRGDAVEFSLADNGRGFDWRPAAESGGNGLANIRRRVARVGGAIAWESAPGQGTRVTLTVRFPGRRPMAVEPVAFP